MAELPAADVVRRLERLERQNRTLRRTGLGGAALALAGVLVGASREPPRVLEAEKFVVRDAEGRERVVLGLDHPSSPQHSPVRLGLYNEAQQSSAVLYLSDAFAGLAITTRGAGGRGTWSTHLFANPREGTGFKVDTGMKRPAVRLGAGRDADGRIVLYDEGGRERFRAP